MDKIKLRLTLATVLLSLGACADDSDENEDSATTDASSSGSSESATSTTSGASGSGTTGDATSGDASSEGSVGSDSSGPGTSSSGGTTGDTEGSSGSSTGAQDNVVYGAVRLPPAALDRLVIYRADFGADVCTRIRLNSPPGGLLYADLTTPDYWSAYEITVSEGADECSDTGPAAPTVEATAATGTISWDEEGPGACPLDLDIDVSLEFPAGAAWVPSMQTLSATIDVDGCPM